MTTTAPINPEIATPPSTPPSGAVPVYDERLRHRRYSTVYRIRLSALYHLKRERFFDLVDKTFSAVTVAAATTAVGALLQLSGPKGLLELTATAIAAAMSVTRLVFNPSSAARRHGQAAAEFRHLLAECEHAGERWAESQCDQFAGRVVELEASEPAPLAALVANCQNQLAIASGAPENVVTLTRCERWLMHFFDFDAAKINARSASGV